MKPIIIIVLLILVPSFLICPLLSIADVFYVETDGSDENDGSEDNPWGTIQGAIDNPAVEDDDTIYVGSGTHTENVNVSKSVKIYGDDTESTVISAEDSSDSVFRISSNDVSLKNLIIEGANGSEAVGVYVGSGFDYCSIRRCELKNHEYGIYMKNTEDAVIYDNTFENNEIGLYLNRADGSNITYNYFSNNTVGIYLVGSETADIDSNDLGNGDYGIFLQDDEDDYYSDDDISQLEDGNAYDNIEKADVYLGEEDELNDNAISCFIDTICVGRNIFSQAPDRGSTERTTRCP